MVGSALARTMWTCVAAIVLAVAHMHAHAQGVYRIVGSDGRVTYSDQAPATVSRDARVDVLRAPRGGPVPAAPDLPVRDAPAGPGSPKRALAEPRAAMAAVPVSAAPDLAVEAAVIGVLGYEDLVKRTESICLATLPTSMRRYTAAVDDWARRNARTVVVARNVLAREIPVDRREGIEEEVRRRNAALLQPVIDAPAASRIGWCDRSMVEIAGGRMDVHDKPKLAGALAAVPAR